MLPYFNQRESFFTVILKVNWTSYILTSMTVTWTLLCVGVIANGEERDAMLNVSYRDPRTNARSSTVYLGRFIMMYNRANIASSRIVHVKARGGTRKSCEQLEILIEPSGAWVALINRDDIRGCSFRGKLRYAMSIGRVLAVIVYSDWMNEDTFQIDNDVKSEAAANEIVIVEVINNHENHIAELVDRQSDVCAEIIVGHLQHPSRWIERYKSPGMFTVTLFTLGLLGIVGLVVVIFYCANKFTIYNEEKDTANSTVLQMSDICEENEERDDHDVHC